MKLNTALVHLGLATLSTATLFKDIVKGLLNTNRYNNLVNDVPSNFIQDLKDDESKAGQFICDILSGDGISALGDVASDLSSEALDDFSAVTSLIGGLPTLAPAVLSAIEHGAETAVSIVEELVTNPGAAITVIVGDVETVVEDAYDEVTSIGGEVVTAIECLFGCEEPASATSAATGSGAGAALFLKSSCESLSAMQTVPVTTTGYVSYPVASTTGTGLGLQSASPSLRPSLARSTGVSTDSAPAGAGGAVVSSGTNASVPSSTPQSGEAGKGRLFVSWVWGGMLACVFAVMVML